LDSEPGAFADLSKLTELCGGNVLFHLEKRSNAGMILQKGERKDYFITTTSFRYKLKDLNVFI